MSFNLPLYLAFDLLKHFLIAISEIELVGDPVPTLTPSAVAGPSLSSTTFTLSPLPKYRNNQRTPSSAGPARPIPPDQLKCNILKGMSHKL